MERVFRVGLVLVSNLLMLCLIAFLGTQAVARCCSLQGLSCSYKTAGPSGTGVDDQVLVPCADSEYPFGKLLKMALI